MPRRDALARLGLSLLAVYSAPTVLHLEREASATRIQPSCHAKGKAKGNPWCRDRGDRGDWGRGGRDRDDRGRHGGRDRDRDDRDRRDDDRRWGRDRDDGDRWRSSRRDDDGRPRFRGSGRPRDDR